MPRKKKSEAPELFHYGGDLTKSWYIGFRFTCPDTGRRIPRQIRAGINFHNTISERKREAEATILLIKESLAKGWNPIRQSFEDFVREDVKQEDPLSSPASLVDALPSMLFCKAMDFVLTKKKGDISPRTLDAYKGFHKLLIAAAKNVGVEQLSISKVKKGHCRLLLNEISRIKQEEYDKEGKGKEFSASSYNKFKKYLSAFFFELEEWEAIEFNPAKKLTRKDQEDTGIHRHATDQEIAIIKEQLPLVAPALYEFLRFEYVTGMRPEEMLKGRFTMIDHRNSYLRLSYKDGKTKIYREVPLPAFLMTWLRERQQGHSVDDFIFGQGLVPGPIPARRNWVSIQWRKVVKDGLGINVSLYSFKGRGADDKIDAGISLDAVSTGFGHTSTRTTKIYLRKHGERLRKEVIANAPDL